MSELQASSQKLLTGLFERMVTIRKFEERVSDLFSRGKLPGFVHLYIGQEAVAVGVCSSLRNNDFITSTHRGHGHVIAKGGDVSKMMAELYGKSTGYCKGKGGSMHITDVGIGILGANGIVAGGIPIAVGAAYGSSRIRRTDQVSVAFFGDGATSEGAFHEALNMAAAWKLPVVFVCENNLYGVGTRISRVAVSEEMILRAAAYKMPAVSVDGNDVLAVRKAATDAVDRARLGEGPTFLECKTWRHRGHFEGENPRYWDRKERLKWLDRDPLIVFSAWLIEQGLLSREEIGGLVKSVEEKISEAVRFAEDSAYPSPKDALADLYA